MTQQPVRQTSYDTESQGASARGRRAPSRSDQLWPTFSGLLGALGLSLLYLGIVSLAESWAHALTLFQEDAPFVIPIILGFGVQIGLLTYIKRGQHLRVGARGAGALTGTGGGTSTLAMVACCAHHVTDVLPLAGLSGAAIFLAQYKVPFMVIGLVSSAASITVLLTKIRKSTTRV